MTWLRQWQLSAEGQSVADVAGLGGSGFDISATEKYTGGYSYRTSGTDVPLGVAGLASVAARCNFMLLHNGALSDTLLLPIVGMVVDGANLAWFWRPSDNEITLLAGYESGTSTRRFAVSITDDALASEATWYSVGMVAYMAAAGGFVSLYVDGVQIASWTGDTRIYRSGEIAPRTSINAVYAAGYSAAWNLAVGAGTSYNNYTYVDDLYADYGDGSEADTPPATRRFFPRFRAVAADIQAQMTPVGAGTNGECIGDAPPDDDTTYVLAGGAGLKDIYPLTDVDLPDNYAPRAVIVQAYAKKTDAGVASTLTPGLYDAVRGSIAGTAQTLSVSYNYAAYRFTGSILGGAWSEAMINDTAMSIESSGAYS